MEDFQASIGQVPTGGKPKERATAKLEEVLESTSQGNPQWTRQSFLRRGVDGRSRRETVLGAWDGRLKGLGIKKTKIKETRDHEPT